MLLAVHGDASGEFLVAVGVAGRILHWDGVSWGLVPSGTAKDLHDVWVAAPDLAFAVGDDGTVLRWDGAVWESITSDIGVHLYGVWAEAGDRVLVCGAGSKLYSWDGSVWQAESPPAGGDFHDIWGFSWTEVFIATTTGQVMRRTPSGWVDDDVGGPALNGIWGRTAEDVIVVGDRGSIFRFDGQGWSQMASGTSEDLYSVWGAAGGGALAVGGAPGVSVALVHGGEGWVEVMFPEAAQLKGVWADDAGDYYVVGEQGWIYRGDGDPATPTPGPTPSPGWGWEPSGILPDVQAVYALLVDPGGAVFAGSRGGSTSDAARLYRSVDLGDTWELVGDFGGEQALISLVRLGNG
jgi:hypothetical protein